MANLEKLVEELSTLTVLEAAQLSKLLEEKWGVSAESSSTSFSRLAICLSPDVPNFVDVMRYAAFASSLAPYAPRTRAT